MITDLKKQVNNFIRLHPSYYHLKDELLQDSVLEHLERQSKPDKQHLSKSAKSIFSCVKQRHLRRIKKESDFLQSIVTTFDRFQKTKIYFPENN